MRTPIMRGNDLSGGGGESASGSRAVAEGIAEELARLRFDRGLTEEELAVALGVSRRQIHELDSGAPTLFPSRLFELLRELGAHAEVVSVGAESADAVDQRP